MKNRRGWRTIGVRVSSVVMSLWRSRRVLTGAVAAIASASAAVACGQILGINDRTLDTSDGAAMTSGSSGDSGATSGSSAPSGAASGASGATAGSGTSATSGTMTSGATSGTASGAASGTTTSGATAGTGSGAVSGTSSGESSGTTPACPDPCVLASGLDHPFGMASDTTRVYWTEYGDTQGSANGSVKGCLLAGCGGHPTVYGQALINPREVASDGKNVYWGTATYSSVPGGIWSCAVAGCASPTRLAAAAIPYGIALDANYVYWVDNDAGTVHRVGKAAGSPATVLYDGGIYDDAGDTISLPEQLVVDTSALYFTDDFATVFRLPIGGGLPVQIAPGTHGGGWPVAVDASWVYFGQSGNILRAAKTATNGGVTIGNVIDPVGLAVDPAVSGLVYWADWGSGNANDGTVGKVTSDGKSQIILASSQAAPEAVTVSGPYVFWLSNGTLSPPPSLDTVPSTGKLFRSAK